MPQLLLLVTAKHQSSLCVCLDLRERELQPVKLTCWLENHWGLWGIVLLGLMLLHA